MILTPALKKRIHQTGLRVTHPNNNLPNIEVMIRSLDADFHSLTRVGDKCYRARAFGDGARSYKEIGENPTDAMLKLMLRIATDGPSKP